MHGDRLLRVLLVVFMLSGFSGLIYESIWSHYLKLLLGHAGYAQTLVLAIFMGGMALGSWIASRRGRRWGSLLRGYAVAEGLIGLAAFVFDPLFRWFTAFAFEQIIPQLGSPGLVYSFKWGSAAALILPQAVLLGMTFPLMSAGLIRRSPAVPGRNLALLYFVNSIGGALGVLASGFLLIRWLGLPGTIQVAGGINIVLAAVVYLLCGGEPEPRPERAERHAAGPYDRGLLVVLLGVALLTGAASFIYEIAWIRMLSLVLGTSTHAFELMLSAFILGLALGGLWVRNRIDSHPSPLRFLGVVQIVMGSLALATLPLYRVSFDVMTGLLGALDRDEAGYFLFNLVSHSIAAAVMIPATFCAGMTLPLITFLLLRGGHGEKSIGLVYGANTVGAIVGVMFAVHVGMAMLGLKGLLVAGAGIDILVGLYLLRRVPRRERGSRSLVFSGLALLALALTFGVVRLDAAKMAAGVYRGIDRDIAKKIRVLDAIDGKTATVTLTDEDGVWAIRTNGKPDATINMNAGGRPTRDEVTNVLLGTLPLMLMPRAETVALVGIGSGVTTHVLLTHPGLRSVDTIEIESAMVRVARRFGAHNERTYSDSRSRLHIEDAKTFFSTQQGKYDVIVSEPSNPWVSGVAGLFSVEYYDTIRRHLTPDGLFVQWIQLYEIDIELVASMLKALSIRFDDYALFASNFGDLVVVASADGVLPSLDPQLFKLAGPAAELSRIGIRSLQDVETKRVGNRRLLEPLLDTFSIRPNSDYFPVVDQRAARARFLQHSAQGLISIVVEPLPLFEVLESTTRRWERSTFEPTDHFGSLSPFFKATLLRDIVDGDLVPGVRAGEPSVSEAIRDAQRMYAECREIPRHGDRVFVLLELARATAPYLRPEEMEKFWTRLSTSPCIAELSGIEREWFALVRAVSERDPAGMAASATKLLRSEQGLTSARQKYLLAASMTGRIALGETAACARIWSDHARATFGEAQPSVMFRLLAAHCGLIAG